jgi:hypothetical protein
MQSNIYKSLILSTLVLLLFNFKLSAQSLADGVFIPKNGICAGLMYGYESWVNYWEGTLKRDNLNLGTVSTQSMALMATYGINSKLNIVAGVPYIWTKASAGTLAGQNGIQDLTLGLKYNALNIKANDHQLNLSAAVGGSLPLSNYTPDLLPLSIGLHSGTVFGRGILQYNFKEKWSFTAQAAYTSRDMVKLDRESYFTTRQIYSNEVAMPDVFSFGLRGGYVTKKMAFELLFEQMNTLGGFDIRRNDMPFVSNEMDATRVGAMAYYTISQLADLQILAGFRYTLNGRNVGQTTSYNFGIMKAFSLSKPSNN